MFDVTQRFPPLEFNLHTYIVIVVVKTVVHITYINKYIHTLSHRIPPCFIYFSRLYSFGTFLITSTAHARCQFDLNGKC
jgi:hypothetical protein